MFYPFSNHSEPGAKQCSPPNSPPCEYKSPIAPPKAPASARKQLSCGMCKSKRCLVTCKCQQSFCLKHRYATEHACSYDNRGEAKALLRAQLPLVVADKLERI
jgi:hypothetical protein